MPAPSDIIRIYSNILARADLATRVVAITGIYRQDPNGRCYNGLFYDIIVDENTNSYLTAVIPQRLRDVITHGNLISANGTITINSNNQGQLKILFQVSSVDVVQHQAISEEDSRRFELRSNKQVRGMKNVKSILENILMKNERRPSIALVFAENSITDADFQAGINAAHQAIDFHSFRVNFARSNELVSALTRLDTSNFDAIAIIRGGGAGLEHLDAIPVLERISTLNTPLIGAVGHVRERLFFKDMVDWLCPTPNGVAQQFSELVERVNHNRENSIAVITQQVRAQFQQEITNQRNQNTLLNQQLIQQRAQNQQTITQLTTNHQQEIRRLTEANQRDTSRANTEIDNLRKQLNDALDKANGGSWKYIAFIAIIIAAIVFLMK